MVSHSLSVRAYRMIEVSFRSLNHNPIIVSNARPDVLNQVYSRHRIWPSKKGKNDPIRKSPRLPDTLVFYLRHGLLKSSDRFGSAFFCQLVSVDGQR